MCGTVYQNASHYLACQFTFACDGKRKLINERGAWARANRIAKQTLNGQIYLPEVGKSTHYHALYVHPNWVREMHRLARYGIHAFYRPIAWGNGADEPVWGTHRAGPGQEEVSALKFQLEQLDRIVAADFPAIGRADFGRHRTTPRLRRRSRTASRPRTSRAPRPSRRLTLTSDGV